MAKIEIGEKGHEETEEINSTALELDDPKRSLRVEVTGSEEERRGLKVQVLTDDGWEDLFNAAPGTIKINGRHL